MNKIVKLIKDKIEDLKELRQDFVNQRKETFNPFTRKRIAMDIQFVTERINAYEVLLEELTKEEN